VDLLKGPNCSCTKCLFLTLDKACHRNTVNSLSGKMRAGGQMDGHNSPIQFDIQRNLHRDRACLVETQPADSAGGRPKQSNISIAAARR
jgi:hypothetical protein